MKCDDDIQANVTTNSYSKGDHFVHIIGIRHWAGSFERDCGAADRFSYSTFVLYLRAVVREYVSTCVFMPCGDILPYTL